jgi:hypothetical protein
MNYLEDELHRGFDKSLYQDFLQHCNKCRQQFRPNQATLVDQFLAGDFTAILKRVEQRREQQKAAMRPPDEVMDTPRRIKMVETGMSLYYQSHASAPRDSLRQFFFFCSVPFLSGRVVGIKNSIQ